ncbi:MAG: hypothetical protein AVDCRST_MAG79-2479, partial [uncultured Thermoleophilia bacterium]
RGRHPDRREAALRRREHVLRQLRGEPAPAPRHRLRPPARPAPRGRRGQRVRRLEEPEPRHVPGALPARPDGPRHGRGRPRGAVLEPQGRERRQRARRRRGRRHPGRVRPRRQGLRGPGGVQRGGARDGGLVQRQRHVLRGPDGRRRRGLDLVGPAPSDERPAVQPPALLGPRRGQGRLRAQHRLRRGVDPAGARAAGAGRRSAGAERGHRARERHAPRRQRDAVHPAAREARALPRRVARLHRGPDRRLPGRDAAERQAAGDHQGAPRRRLRGGVPAQGPERRLLRRRPRPRHPRRGGRPTGPGRAGGRPRPVARAGVRRGRDAARLGRRRVPPAAAPPARL